MQQVQKPRVLVIDEERRSLRLAQAFLMREYDVTACEDPREALSIIEQEAFHVLVLSHHMRAFDVFAFAARAKEVQPHLPCLVISNTARPHDAEMQKSGVACITSPYHPATMLDLMARLVVEGEQAARSLYADQMSQAADGAEIG